VSSPRSATELALAAVLAPGCITAENAFLGGRLPILCDQSYYTCNVTAGCALDGDHYISDSFPGTRRVIVTSADANSEWQVRMFLTDLRAPGSELLIQMYEPTCTLDVNEARVYFEGDLFAEAGNDRTLVYDLHVFGIGEHLLEIYSDASTGYDLIVERTDGGVVEETTPTE
jgi:hypothetical protein